MWASTRPIKLVLECAAVIKLDQPFFWYGGRQGRRRGVREGERQGQGDWEESRGEEELGSWGTLCTVNVYTYTDTMYIVQHIHKHPLAAVFRPKTLYN